MDRAVLDSQVAVVEGQDMVLKEKAEWAWDPEAVWDPAVAWDLAAVWDLEGAWAAVEQAKVATLKSLRNISLKDTTKDLFQECQVTRCSGFQDLLLRKKTKNRTWQIAPYRWLSSRLWLRTKN